MLKLLYVLIAFALTTEDVQACDYIVSEHKDKPRVREIILQADAAVAGNRHSADFRFEPKQCMAPLLMLLGAEENDKHTYPCSDNFQMIFHRKRCGEALVKFLRNGNEVDLPAVEPVKKGYYRWQDVRRHLLMQMGDYKVLPAYYNEYLHQKASEILDLKKQEADGFFFWTDTHYPDNAGNTAAIIEYLQKMAGPTKLFCGGDVALNADSLKDGMEANTSSWLQACANGLFFPIRGNHDFTSSTSWLVSSPETMNNLEVHRYLSSFTSPDAETNNSESTSNYYYVDNPKAKIRYLVLDSTDSVKDARVKYGVSEPQYDWFCEVTSSLPKGWAIMFLSHVPLARDHSKQTSIVKVGDAIAELSLKSNVLLALCGHRHSDVESGISHVFQVITAGDCLVDMGKIQTPYSVKSPKKSLGTIDEHTIDYVSISKDFKRVIMKRIGYGCDRIFNVKPIPVSEGDKIQLKTVLTGDVNWFAYDAEGNEVIQMEDGWNRLFKTSHKNATVSPEGCVTILAPAPSIIVATDSHGTKEYFMLTTPSLPSSDGM